MTDPVHPQPHGAHDPRRDQVHAEIVDALNGMVHDTQLSLRAGLPPSALAPQLAARAMNSPQDVVATIYAAAVVTLAHERNTAYGLQSIELPSIDMPDDGPGLHHRATRFLGALNELMMSHGIVLRSALNMWLEDPVKQLTVADSVHFDDMLARYGASAPPPYTWKVPTL